jgi:membrane fusion protein (multidrug efflux system)
VERRPVSETYEFNGRIQATDTVEIVSREAAFLEKQLFVEGAEVKKGDLLYVLERAPFEAEVNAEKAAVAQAEAQLQNQNIQLNRQQRLLTTSAGTQEGVDNALAAQRSGAAQLEAAKAQLDIAQVHLGYTEIRSPINGRVGRSLVTIGNVVTPSSGTLTTVVSQDPMYVIFPVPTRSAIELRDEYGEKNVFDSLKIRLRLPDGSTYDQVGQLDFINNTISRDTDSLIVRAVIPNPAEGAPSAGGAKLRELIADEFVTVIVEAAEPRQVIAVPRNSILSDQQGSYVFTVDKDNVAHQRRVQLGQSTPETASVTDGLAVGDRIVVEGIQRVRPDAPVTPQPPSSPDLGSAQG